LSSSAHLPFPRLSPAPSFKGPIDDIRIERYVKTDGLSLPFNHFCQRYQVATNPYCLCWFFFFKYLLTPTDFNWALPQLPDVAVTDLRLPYDANASADAESPTTSRIATSRDPYNIGHGLKTDAEIAELRRRKQGKRLANYHRRQNDVRIFFGLNEDHRLTEISRTAYCFSPKTHGRAHRGC
jgi:hypothetical protein